jgi:hypothetical protein
LSLHHARELVRSFRASRDTLAMLPSERFPHSSRPPGRELDLADAQRQAELWFAIWRDLAQGTMINPHTQTRIR